MNVSGAIETPIFDMFVSLPFCPAELRMTAVCIYIVVLFSVFLIHYTLLLCSVLATLMASLRQESKRCVNEPQFITFM